jgi:hypothetical protein
MTPIGVCDVCARIVQLDNTGRIRRHDVTGPLIRARVGKRRKRCAGSGRWPREAARGPPGPRH